MGSAFRSLRRIREDRACKKLLKQTGAQDMCSSGEAKADIPEATVAARGLQAKKNRSDFWRGSPRNPQSTRNGTIIAMARSLHMISGENNMSRTSVGATFILFAALSPSAMAQDKDQDHDQERPGKLEVGTIIPVRMSETIAVERSDISGAAVLASRIDRVYRGTVDQDVEPRRPLGNPERVKCGVDG